MEKSKRHEYIKLTFLLMGLAIAFIGLFVTCYYCYNYRFDDVQKIETFSYYADGDIEPLADIEPQAENDNYTITNNIYTLESDGIVSVNLLGGKSTVNQNLLDTMTAVRGEINSDYSVSYNYVSSDGSYPKLVNFTLGAGTYTIKTYAISGNINNLYLFINSSTSYYSLNFGKSFTLTETTTISVNLMVNNDNHNIKFNIMLNSGNTALPFQQYFSGIKFESPLYINKVGKNLINIDDFLLNKNINTSGAMVDYNSSSDSCICNPNFIPITSNMYYGFDFSDILRYGFRVAFYSTNNESGFISRVDNFTFNVPSNAKFIRIGAYITTKITESELNNLKFVFGVNDNITSYVPYQATTLTLEKEENTIESYLQNYLQTNYGGGDWFNVLGITGNYIDPINHKAYVSYDTDFGGIYEIDSYFGYPSTIVIDVPANLFYGNELYYKMICSQGDTLYASNFGEIEYNISQDLQSIIEKYQSESYKNGYDDGYDIGYDDGEQYGNVNGYTDGYNQGVSDTLADIESYYFSTQQFVNNVTLDYYDNDERQNKLHVDFDFDSDETGSFIRLYNVGHAVGTNAQLTINFNTQFVLSDFKSTVGFNSFSNGYYLTPSYIGAGFYGFSDYSNFSNSNYAILTWNNANIVPSTFKLYFTGYSTDKDLLQKFYDNGYENGQIAGSNTGYKAGYNKGFEDGANNQNALANMVLTVAGVPFETFYQIWHFNVLGFNFADFIFGILSLLIVIYIIKKII